MIVTKLAIFVLSTAEALALARQIELIAWVGDWMVSWLGG